MSTTIYLISGLGADQRVFSKLDLSNFQLNYIEWILPASKESLGHYASRLCAQVMDKEPVLIGVSFGGMIAIEMAKVMKTKRVIIISSAKSYRQLPHIYRLAGKLRLDSIFSPTIFKRFTFLMNWLFSVKDKEYQRLLASMVQEMDNRFLKWAIGEIIRWKNEDVEKSIISIHGTHDRILPFHGANHSIRGGGHLMILQHSGEVSAVLQRVLTS